MDYSTFVGLEESDNTTFVGLDVHKETIAVAVAKEGYEKPESLGQIPNTPESLLKLLKRLSVSNSRLAFCYESGPCGYEIYRLLKERDIYCIVAATSLVPVRAGDRVKTDRRDARKLAASVHASVVAALRALRGVDYITAITLVAELGDISRFSNLAQLMAYAGIVPSEHSSGLRHRRGSITKTGNKHIRRVVVEAAWHYRREPKVSVKLRRRQEGVSESVKEISWKAQNRLNLKFRKLLGRGKPSQKAVVAVGRELLGFIWSIASQVNVEMSKAA